MATIRMNGRKRLRRTQQDDFQHKSYLPLDIIRNILSRLEAKTLLRFKTVSKSWNETISDPLFIKAHLDHSKNSDSKTLIHWETRYDNLLTRFENGEFQPTSLILFPCEKYRFSDMLCSCEGLILSVYGEIYLIWNPSTRAYIMFRWPYRVVYKKLTHGLCYDPSTGDYKVVVVSEGRYAVFSCKKNEWTKKKDFSYSGIALSPGVYFNGKLYWVVIQRKRDYGIVGYVKYHKGRFLEFDPRNYITETLYRDYPHFESDPNCAHEIVYFDPVDDSYKKIERPDGVEENDIFYLTTLRGSLCLYRSWFDKKFIEIWMMKDGGERASWMKLMSLENVPVPIYCTFVLPLCLTIENQIVLYFEGNEEFIVFTPQTNAFEKLGKLWADDVRVHSNILTHLDSLSMPFKSSRPKRKLEKMNFRS